MILSTDSLNLSANSTSDNLSISQGRLAKSLARISSGTKIVQPSDDSAGLAMATRLDAEIHRAQGAKTNISNAMSYVQTQEGYLKKIAKALDRMSELSIMAQDAVKSGPDRELYNKEYSELKGFIGQAISKEFNGVPLFSNGSANIPGPAMDVTIDADGNTFPMDPLDPATASFFTIASGAGDILTTATASIELAAIKVAITDLSSARATGGAYQTRLNYAGEQLMVNRENLSAASSRIQDVDVAEESTEYARANIMVQSGTAMLAQANQIPQGVLRLLQ